MSGVTRYSGILAVALVAALVVAAPAGAQEGRGVGSLRGQVVDDGGEPVAGAPVQLLEGRRLTRTTAADGSGRYRVEGVPAGSYTVRVEVVGYRTLERQARIEAGKELSLRLVLEAAPVELAALEVVSATRSSTPLATIPGAVSVVDREELEEQARLSRNLGDLLGKVVPGFSAGVESPSLWGQSLRGRNVSVLIDGVPQSTARNVSRDLSTIDPSVIERVEVLRGATAIYGNGATGGVINIITRSTGESGPRFTTGVGTEAALSRPGAGVGSHARQAVTGRRGDFSYAVNASFARTGGYFDAEGDRVSPDPTGQGGLADTDTWDVFGKFGLTIGEQHLQLSINHFDSEQHTEHAVDPAVATLPPGEAKARTREGLDLEEQQGSKNTVVSLDYRHKAVFGSRVHGQLYYRDYLTRFGPYDGRAARTMGYNFIQSYLDSWRAGGRLEVETAFPGGNAPTVLWGLDYAAEETSQPVGIIDGEAYDQSGGVVFRRVGTDIWVPPMEPRELGLFAQLSWSPTARLVLRGGLRHERVHMYVDDFVTLAGDSIRGGRLDFDPVLFNVGAVLSATDAVSLFGNFSQGFSLTDIGLFLRSAPAGFQVGTKTLKPQMVDHVELGVRTASPTMQSSLSAFYNESELGTSSAGFDMNVVRAPERVYGVEATLDVKPAERWGVGGTITWTEGEFDPGEDGTYRALNGWRIQPLKATGYVESETLPGWRNRLQVLYSGDRDRAFEERPNPNVVGFGERAVTSYAVVDWVSSLRAGPGTLDLSVENLFNNQYFPVASQLLRSGNNTTYAPARGATLGVGYSVSY